MMEVVLTGSSGITSNYNAAHLKLEAQDSKGNTLPGSQAVNQCDNCASIGIQPWPQGLASFLVTVTLGNINDGPTLYAANVAA